MTIGDFTRLDAAGYVPPGKNDFVSPQPVWYQHEGLPDEIFDGNDGSTITGYPFGAAIISSVFTDPANRPAGWDAPPNFTATAVFSVYGFSTSGTIRCYAMIASPEPALVSPPYSGSGYTPDVYVAFSFYYDNAARVSVDSGQITLKLVVTANYPSAGSYTTETTTYTVDPGASGQQYRLVFSHPPGSNTVHLTYLQSIELQTSSGTHVATYLPTGAPSRPVAYTLTQTHDQVLSFDWAEDIGNV